MIRKYNEIKSDLILIKASLELHGALLSEGAMAEIIDEEEKITMLKDIDRIITMYEEMIEEIKELK